MGARKRLDQRAELGERTRAQAGAIRGDDALADASFAERQRHPNRDGPLVRTELRVRSHAVLRPDSAPVDEGTRSSTKLIGPAVRSRMSMAPSPTSTRLPRSWTMRACGRSSSHSRSNCCKASPPRPRVVQGLRGPRSSGATSRARVIGNWPTTAGPRSLLHLFAFRSYFALVGFKPRSPFDVWTLMKRHASGRAGSQELSRNECSRCCVNVPLSPAGGPKGP
jgi:hypothetical protein